MARGTPDPYQTLGVSPRVGDDELRAVYRRLVQLHHPDHNRGSATSARRFEAIQDAYAQIRELRRAAPASRPPPAGRPPRPPAADPDVQSRLADLERELREAQAARERARQAARSAATASAGRASDEELGYVSTDDSFAKILADARDEISGRFSQAREHPVGRRVADLIDELEGLASKLTDERSPRTRD